MLKQYEDLLNLRINGDKLLIGNGSKINENVLESGVSSYYPYNGVNSISWVSKEEFEKVKGSFGTKKEGFSERKTYGGIEMPNMLGEPGGFIFAYNEKAHFYYQAKLEKSPFEILENSRFTPPKEFIELRKFFSGLEEKAENPIYYYVASSDLHGISEEFMSFYNRQTLKDNSNHDYDARYIGRLEIHGGINRENRVSNKGISMVATYSDEKGKSSDKFAIACARMQQQGYHAIPDLDWLGRDAVTIYGAFHSFSGDFRSYIKKRGIRIIKEE